MEFYHKSSQILDYEQMIDDECIGFTMPCVCLSSAFWAVLL